MADLVSAVKDGGHIVLTYDDGAVFRRSIVYEDCLVTEFPEGYSQVLKIYVSEVGAMGAGPWLAVTYIDGFGEEQTALIDTQAASDLTGEEIVQLLEALTAGNRLSHTKLDDVGASDHHTKTTSISDLTDHNKTAHDALNIDADTVDGDHLSDIESTMDSKITTHKGDASAHHTKYTDAEAVTAAKADADISDAISKKHAQNSDTDLDDAFEATFEKVANKGAANGYASLDASSVVAQDPKVHASRHQTGGADILYMPRTYVWFVPGTLETGTEQATTFRMKRATTVEDIELHVKTAPTGAALIIDINDNGTTIFSTRPEIDAGSTTEDNNHVISDSAIAAGAELTMDIDQVGSTVAGEDLTVLLHCKEPVI